MLASWRSTWGMKLRPHSPRWTYCYTLFSSAVSRVSSRATSGGNLFRRLASSGNSKAHWQNIKRARPTVCLTLLRHGESTWNSQNRFTGWVDVPLTNKGLSEAFEAGKLLNKARIPFEVAYVSRLARAIHTLEAVQKMCNTKNSATVVSWRLNERHYGSLQGRGKADVENLLGAQLVRSWRRSYDTRPPALSRSNPSHPANDPKYKDVQKSILPDSESLRDVRQRVKTLWDDELSETLRQGKHTLIVSHANTIRALLMMIDGVKEEQIPHVYIPTGIPLLYELDAATLEPSMCPKDSPVYPFKLRGMYIAPDDQVNERIKKLKI